ncbi:MFS transporter [Pseudoduganella violacea]|uniref:MFS family permease n=1 Tax=Pseudoduganella violacea TaxID=1715466 RepID=A0A7W5BFB4_9BURK|nr:MFS transporter [Pseudoduganella violacea]MBB3122142.1 MFS family permease [Pseudoduganella violacea]
MDNMQSPASALANGKSGSLGALLATVLLPFALGHFISYLYRVINAVVYPDLARDLGLAADSIGLLTGAYFLTFAAAQLPIGVALDRYGPRRVQAPMLLLAAGGAVLFAQAQSVEQLVLARGLIGLGVAGSLMASIKASSLWLPPERLPLATALLLSVGGMGAMASTAPLQAALQYTQWRGAFLALAIGTLLVSAIIYFVVPEHGRKQPSKLRDMAAAVRDLYSSWSFWRLALYSIVAHATYMAVQSLWMGSWLRDMAHLDRSEVANVLLAGAMAMVAGSLFFGWLTDYLGKFGIKPLLVCGCGIWVFVAVQLMMAGGVNLNPYVAAVGFSFFGTATTMNYAIVAQSVPSHLTGRVSTSFNLLVFLLAFVVQWSMGLIINLWTPERGAYPAPAYHYAFGIIVALQIPGMLLWLSFKPWRRACL